MNINIQKVVFFANKGRRKNFLGCPSTVPILFGFSVIHQFMTTYDNIVTFKQMKH